MGRAKNEISERRKVIFFWEKKKYVRSSSRFGGGTIYSEIICDAISCYLKWKLKRGDYRRIIRSDSLKNLIDCYSNYLFASFFSFSSSKRTEIKKLKIRLIVEIYVVGPTLLPSIARNECVTTLLIRSYLPFAPVRQNRMSVRQQRVHRVLKPLRLTYARTLIFLISIFARHLRLRECAYMYMYKVRSFELTSGKIVKKKKEEKEKRKRERDGIKAAKRLLSFSPATMIILRIPDISLIDFFYCPVWSTSNFVLAGRRSQSYLKLLRASRTTATTS